MQRADREGVLDEELKRRLGAGVEAAGDESETGWAPDPLRGRGVGEGLPVAEEGFGAPVVELGELVKVGRASPPRVLEGLGELPSVDVAPGVDNNHPGLLVEGNHVGLTDRDPRPAGDPKQGLADDLLEARPYEVADLAGIHVGRGVQPTEGDQLVSFDELEQGHEGTRARGL